MQILRRLPHSIGSAQAWFSSDCHLYSSCSYIISTLQDTFEYPELEGHEFVCNHLAPRLKGRPRGRRRRVARSRSHSPSSRSSDSDPGVTHPHTPQEPNVSNSNHNTPTTVYHLNCRSQTSPVPLLIRSMFENVKSACWNVSRAFIVKYRKEPNGLPDGGSWMWTIEIRNTRGTANVLSYQWKW